MSIKKCHIVVILSLEVKPAFDFCRNSAKVKCRRDPHDWSVYRFLIIKMGYK